MRRWLYAALFYAAMAMGQAHADEVTIVLPADQLRRPVSDISTWYHVCQTPEDDLQARAQCLAEWGLRHYHELRPILRAAANLWGREEP